MARRVPSAESCLNRGRVLLAGAMSAIFESMVMMDDGEVDVISKEGAG
jgi:hypothetical protein